MYQQGSRGEVKEATLVERNRSPLLQLRGVAGGAAAARVLQLGMQLEGV